VQKAGTIAGTIGSGEMIKQLKTLQKSWNDFWKFSGTILQPKKGAKWPNRSTGTIAGTIAGTIFENRA
jgi:hypothetical protein